MDLKTLFIVYAAILLACAGSLVITWRQNPHEDGPKSWALGSVTGAVGLFVFAATFTSLEHLVINTVGNFLTWAGIAFYHRGARQYVGVRPATPPWALGLMAVAGSLLVYGVFFSEMPKASQVIAGSFVFAVLCADIVLTLVLRARPRSAPGWFLAFFFGSFGLAHFVRGIATLQEPHLPFYARPVDAAMVFVGIVGGAATAMGFAMLTTERLLTERKRCLERLESGVADLRLQFEGLASGDYSVRAAPHGTGEPMDVLAGLFNQTVQEVEAAFDQIEEQRNVLAAILESMVDGLLLVDAQGVILRGNPSVAQLLGTELDALIGRPLDSVLDAVDHEFAVRLGESVSAAPIRDRSVQFLRMDGVALALTVNASAHRDGAGVLVGAVLVLRDDRDVREAQAKLQMTDRLAAMGTVAAGVAHEINNPLAFVVSNIDFAIDELQPSAPPLTAEARQELLDALESARRGGERVRQIVKDLKTLSRSEGEGTGPIDVNRLVESAAAMLHNEIRHHARLELALGLVRPVLAVEAKLGQVFLNLIHNAAQAIPAGHADENTITVTTGLDAGGQVVVEVRDTGTGIAPEHLHRVFDAFFTTKPVGVGTGLGLSICHRIVSGLGGRIEVKSTKGEGSTFRVLLPALAEAELGAVAPEAPVQTEGDGRRRILVVDDEPEVGQAIRRILGREHTVDVVRQARAALELLATTRYDLVLCDVMMPEMTGMEFFSQVEAHHPAVAPTLVFMSGGAFSPAAREFLRSTKNRVIEKPFESSALRQLVGSG